MVIDSSALLAILFTEDDADLFREAMLRTNACKMSMATLVEASIVAQAEGDAFATELERLLVDLRIEFVPQNMDQVAAAREGFRRFGKGRHPARLNFGDTFAYALAMHLDEPLLFKGNDFAQTDVTPAV